VARIMIVDDASFMRGSLQYIVEKSGHEVVATASEGREALEAYRRFRPDLTTLDILMKGEDGIWALKAIREVNPKAKVIMVTALGLENKQEEARALGASGYVRKPFEPGLINDEVNRVLTLVD
jgi:two-component system, chemotaxis family, chemotaxis protein CheY